MGAQRYEIYLRVFNSISRLNTRRSISYLQAPMYYSIYYINLAQFFQKVNIPKVISGHMCLVRGRYKRQVAGHRLQVTGRRSQVAGQ